MTILVTGVAGFIGSNFLHYYLSKYKDRKVIGVDSLTYAGNLENISGLMNNKNFEFIKADITDAQKINEIFEKYEIDGVINFAAESHVDRSIHDPQIFLKTNILGTQTLLDACKKSWYKDGRWSKDKKYLQISTDEVYGALGKTGYFTEETPLDPHSPYSASKASADLIVKAYYDTYKMPMNITRCSNNYGPYQFPEKLIPLMINNALNHKELPIYGDGKQIRDWLHVFDTCIAIDLVFEKAEVGQVYNIGGHNEKENIFIVNKIIETLREKTGDEKINESLIKHVEDRLGHDRRYGIDPSKIKRDLGWEPTIMFEEGIVKTIEWYLNNQDWMKSVISGDYLEFYEKNYK
ncbi:dTDP-glucose 4,6-dehydratase [Tepiditoga spiralis]|uniref:dTDP-glucose 4,6-dehydratase n=1 Tax=Tepiditoga spiralis TaxID=2108365 RepID=A0A7G1G5C4_9BACT|nr:dTDP-glucose 4,6-dehydratase [Tepiditoga spiralis]BBE30234.1 dTDP-glucose 4,6-dehydratase [Tepiditoga spiralis]